MALSLILDILLAVLLVVTIGYAIMLNKRLGALRSDKDELRSLARDFAETTKHAELGIKELRSKTDILEEGLKRAESLRDDLVFLTERGNSAADRLESVVRSSRDQDLKAGTMPGSTTADPIDGAAQNSTSAQPRGAMEASPPDREMVDEVSSAERALLRALRSAG